MNNITSSLNSSSETNNKYRTNAWGDKFIYGAHSTLISSHLLGIKYKNLIILISNFENQSKSEISRGISALLSEYNNLSELEITQILDYAKNNRSLTIYEEERSALVTDTQNNAFIDAMQLHPDLEPVDNIIKNGVFQSSSYQFNAHRGLYNNAYLIPQNSLAAILNAYVSGIRSVEFDVLETSDHVNVVVHDLVTNRLDGSYNEPAKYVEQEPYSAFKSTMIGILNPLSDNPDVQSTGLRGLMKTEDVLLFIYEFMPELTVYIDARNNSPISIINFLKRHPEVKDNVVIKIYPFTMAGGVYDLLSMYSERYNLSMDDAAEEIYNINPNILLAMGSTPSQADERSRLWKVLRGFDFEEMLGFRPSLPYARTSTLGLNAFQGKEIFSQKELEWIEATTWSTVQWAMGFSTVGNILVFQQPLIASLAHIVKNPTSDNVNEFNLMPDNDKRNMAIIDNFNYVYHAVMNDSLKLVVLLPILSSTNLKNRVDNAVFGFSDRYPDFSFANRNGDGSINPNNINNFLYKMDGTVYKKDDYAAIKMRSTRAVSDKISELNSDGLPAQYSTTDLPTDLRVMSMGLAGKLNIPDDITFRASGIVKQRFTPENYHEYTPNSWTTRLYGDAYRDFPTFANDYSALQNEVMRLTKILGPAYYSLELAMNDKGIILNTEALNRLGWDTPVLGSLFEANRLREILNDINSEEASLADSIQEKASQFKNKYGFPFAKEIFFPEDPGFPILPDWPV